ncbi:unnamed protein product [Trichogramma brassicae]|uniref:Uncharacterized protein n=1 Tax=Trichogramma brassicae TaxID=86971 RepID=A0A6H5HU56_9HYME|nr:unnamed protein product [Trichogramma brassicae]
MIRSRSTDVFEISTGPDTLWCKAQRSRRRGGIEMMRAKKADDEFGFVAHLRHLSTFKLGVVQVSEHSGPSSGIFLTRFSGISRVSDRSEPDLEAEQKADLTNPNILVNRGSSQSQLRSCLVFDLQITCGCIIFQTCLRLRFALGVFSSSRGAEE